MYRAVVQESLQSDEELLSTLLLKGVRTLGSDMLQNLYFPTLPREKRLEDIELALKASQIWTKGTDLKLGPKEFAIFIDDYLVIFTKPAANECFLKFVKSVSSQSEEDCIKELQYLLMAFTSTIFTTEDFRPIYNTVRNDHKGLFEVHVRRDGHSAILPPEQVEPPCNSESMGLALLINIVDFQNQPEREGADCDVKNLKALITQLDCNIFREDELHRRGWTEKDLKTRIQEFQAKCDEIKPKYVFLFIGSHGQDGFVTTSDSQQVLYDDIIDLFHDKDEVITNGAMNLQKVPKIIFINACQTWSTCESSSRNHIRTTKNMLTIRPQAKGYDSFRSKEYGSWAVHCFVFVIMNLSYKLSFLELIRQTRKVLHGMDLKDEAIPHGQTLVSTDYCFDKNFHLKTRK